MKPEQITAWALNELSAEERASIEAALRENPATGETAHDMKEFCDFLLHELRDESLALTPEQRERLQSAETPRNVIQPTFSAPRPRWRFVTRFGPIAAAAACAVLGGFLMVEGMKPKTEAVVAAEESELRYPIAPSAESRGSTKDLSRQTPLFGANTTASILSPVLTSSPVAPSLAGPTEPNASPMVVSVPQSQGDRAKAAERGLMLAQSAVQIGNYNQAISAYQDVLRLDPSNTAASRGMELAEKERMEYFKSANNHQRSRMLASVDERWEQSVPPGNAPAVPTNPAAKLGVLEELSQSTQFKKRVLQGSSESYTAIVENELKDVLREPLSTFSIDVDTASYANVRRFLNQNMIPPRDAVRIEELVNYFPTHEEGPAAEAKEPFATRVELAACPWQPRHKLARISIQGREIEKNSKSSNLVFLVDVSGSMNEPQKLPLVQQSLRMLAEQLGEGDRVAMVTYASGTQVVLPPTNGQNRVQIIAAVDQLRAGGSTNGAGGLQLAYEQAVAGFVQGGINRVILCTDGDFNVGISDPAQLEKFIADKARSGVFLSVLGFGSGNLKDRTMESLADKGNGNYAYIDGLAEARKVLVEQMSGTLVTIAKDVKIQIEFNPALVRSYRLIGYENRLLAKEDFNDDTKDAGEIGSGHSVVALYELVPANLPPGEEPARIVDTLKYQTLASPMPDGTMPKLSATAKDSKEIMTVKLRYKQPEGETSQKIEVPVMDADKAITAASAEFKFSAAAAAFGLLLRDSSYKGALTWETVRKLALEGKGPDALGYRGEFLQLIDKAAGLKGARP